MSGNLLVLLLKHTLAVLLVIAVLHALRHASAARRVFAARCGMAALALAPVLWLALPVVPVSLPYEWTARLEAPAVLPPLEWLASAPARDDAFATPARAADAGRLLLWLYLAGVLACVLHMLSGLVRLARIARAADTLQAPAWQHALARLRAQMGVTRTVRLLQSDQVASPLSWGLRAPLIVLDRHSIAHADPDAVIAHELAHIARHDWPAMLVARCLLALYWWHPLMHLWFGRIAQDMECAADDAVLASGVPASRYAQTLLAVSRHAFAPRMASPIAGRGVLLVGRIASVLEARRARGRVSRFDWVGGMAVTAGLIVLLGGMVQRGEQVAWPEQLLSGASPNAGADVAQMLERLNNPNFTQLAAAMRAEDFTRRHAPGHTSFRQRAAIPPLVLALQDARPVIRRLAVWGLSEMRFPETSPAVAVLLADPAPEVRAEAAGALGDIGEKRWLAAMHAMLKDPEPSVRARVAHALGDLADPASAAALTAAEGDADGRVASEVRWALAELR